MKRASFAFDALAAIAGRWARVRPTRSRGIGHTRHCNCVCVTASSMARAPGFAMTGIWASRSARSGLPLIGDGQGVWSWVRIEDAAAGDGNGGSNAGAYNIVDADPYTAMCLALAEP